MIIAHLPGITQIRLPWVNAWILTGYGEAALIDSGTRWDRKSIITAITSAERDGFRLRNVFLTHAHCDHAGNAAYLAERYGARIHCHANEQPYLATRHTYIPSGIRRFGLSAALFAAGELVFPVKRRAPDSLAQTDQCVNSPIGPLRVVETPGHTPGHVSYFQEEQGYLFSGDALINIIPWLRRPGLCLPLKVFSENIPQCADSANKIAALSPRVLFPGHGPPLLENTAHKIRRFLEVHTTAKAP